MKSTLVSEDNRNQYGRVYRLTKAALIAIEKNPQLEKCLPDVLEAILWGRKHGKGS
jgi:hypothetical protein